MTLDYQVGFTWFAEWWRMEQYIKEEKERQRTGARRPPIKGEKEMREERAAQRGQIQAAYDDYKEKLQAQMARSFVQQHKTEEWFKERYDPAIRAAFRQELGTLRREAYAAWEKTLTDGTFDEFTLEGIYKNESNGAGGIVEKEEGEAVAANEVLGVGDLLPIKGGEIRDPAALQPTLLIKTIAPTVSREKMEAFCKEHLGEEDGGFKWLSLSDPNPTKKYHRIGWIVLKPKPNEGPEALVVEDGETAGQNGSAVTSTLAADALDKINGKTIYDTERGDFTCHVGIHEPPSAPRKKALWDLFSAPERIERDLQLATRLANRLDAELGGEIDGVARIDERVEDMRSKGLLQPTNSPTSAKQPPEQDDDEDEGAIDEGEEMDVDDENDDEELLVAKKRLDLTVEYLRRVYSFCMFCVFESDSVHELARKCPGGHLRRPRASLTTAAKIAARATANGEPFPFKKEERKEESDAKKEDDDMLASPTQEKKQPFRGNAAAQQQLQRGFNWVKTYEEKLQQILDPDSVDLRKIGGHPAEEAIEQALNKYVKQEDESKFRCKVPDCTKLFKGHNFWRKHVEKRHEEFYIKIKKEVGPKLTMRSLPKRIMVEKKLTKRQVDLVNAYVLDPAHIAPSRSDANSNGHFPMKDHVPAGTPRGFNLANLTLPPSLANMLSNQKGTPDLAQIAALMAQHGITPNWSAADADGGAGPMRRNRRPNNPAAGPYDRQSKDQRNMRWNQSGRLSPPRGGPGGSGLPRGPPRFGEGGVLAMGPKEAVQGRMLKSYEDLDAAGAASTTELDY
jgi:hypothetical protein